MNFYAAFLCNLYPYLAIITPSTPFSLGRFVVNIMTMNPNISRIKVLFRVTVISLGLFFQTLVHAQNPDSISIDSIYNLFEYTVAFKDANAHLDLYVYNQAPVYIVRKNPTGPSTLGMWNVQNFAISFSTDPDALELQISDEHFFIRGNMAITDAAFDEVVNGNQTSSGRDMFGYIRTSAGWKLLYLHNTVVMANDPNDYSTPIPLSNTVEQVLDSLQSRFNRKATSIGHLFLNSNNLVLSFSDTLSSDFKYSENQLGDYLSDFVHTPDQQTLTFSNTEIIYVDDYLATVFCDYEITTQGQVTETGKTWLNFFGTVANGWRITSWINDVKAQIPLSSQNIKNTNDLEMSTLYPNPATNELIVEMSAPLTVPIQWQITDLKGAILQSGVQKPGANNELIINTQSLDSGMYLLKVQSGTSQSQTQKFVVN